MNPTEWLYARKLAKEGKLSGAAIEPEKGGTSMSKTAFAEKEVHVYRTKGIDANKSGSVSVKCSGKDADAIGHKILEMLQKENRRRRHHGDYPIAYEVQVMSEVQA